MNIKLIKLLGINCGVYAILSEATEIINVIKDVFSSDVDLPLCVSVIDKEGLELFSTSNCPDMIQDTFVLGLMAYEEMNEHIRTRSVDDVDVMIYRIKEETFIVAPIIKELFLVATSDLNKLGHVLPLLEGLRGQIAFKLSLLDKN